MGVFTSATGGVGQNCSEYLRSAWVEREGALCDFMKSLGASNVPGTQAVMLCPVSTSDVKRTFQELKKYSHVGGWGVIIRKTEQVDVNEIYTLPTKVVSKNTQHLFPYIEVHSGLVAWWLTSAWRSNELSKAAWLHGNEGSLIAAAACVRALLETAAAFWCDAQEIAKIWERVKPIGADAVLEAHREFVNALAKVQYGGKFNERVPELNRTWGMIERKNVLSQVEKLDRAVPQRRLQENYQILCNTVHPSVGGTLAMSGSGVMHESGTHILLWFGPTGVNYRDEISAMNPEPIVLDAIVLAAVTAVEVMCKALDDALRLIDDVGLTTRASKLSTFDYWRKLVPQPKQLCPCRSGRISRNCAHLWDKPAPVISKIFNLPELT